MKGTSVINVTEPAFFDKLQTLLETRDLDDWKTYLRWHLVHAKAPHLSSPFANANFDFYQKYLRGVEVMPPRWKVCVRQVDRDLGEALGQVFVQKTFGSDTKARVLKMTNEIEAAMQSEIEQLPWMGDATKKRALEKLHAIANKIGYPDRWRNYSSIKILRDDYFGNVEQATIFEFHRQLAKIGKPVDRDEWQMTPPTVHAYYDAQMNDINFPADLLRLSVGLHVIIAVGQPKPTGAGERNYTRGIRRGVWRRIRDVLGPDEASYSWCLVDNTCPECSSGWAYTWVLN